ncbi:hypothetical protein [Maioricimonas rarisocia]|uniref:hypothetical protein n=1 Tax=Maioricimonas rarisocia TaxID=2528026 RepID=UPI00119DA339|nr:hypothetical protein [Maioricimonas rarisocia]
MMVASTNRQPGCRAPLTGDPHCWTSQQWHPAEAEGVSLPSTRSGEMLPIHHWNWNKADFAGIVVDERHLFFVPKKYHNATGSGIHQFLQDIGRHPTVDPIPDRWILDIEAPWLNQ